MTLIGAGAQRRSRPWLRWLVLGLFVTGFATVVITRVFFGELVRYRGQEMHPAVQDGDWLIILHQRPAMTGDVVLVDASPRPVVRRVVSTAGQKIPQSRKAQNSTAEKSEPETVPEGKVWLRCERPQLCAELPTINLVDLTRIRGVVGTRWVAPF